MIQLKNVRVHRYRWKGQCPFEDVEPWDKIMALSLVLSASEIRSSLLQQPSLVCIVVLTLSLALLVVLHHF